MTDPAVLVEGLRVDRGDRRVVDDITFAVSRGSVTGLLGPSGCGKTTLLRTIVGVQAAASKTVTVLGRPAGHPELRKKIGYATQSPAVYSDMTVAEALRYFAAIVGTRTADTTRVIDEVGLTDEAHHLVGALSGGQRSRANLAVALLGQPELLVLDEPTIGLDPVLRDELWALFRRLTEAGTTLLVSSHVMDEADRCDDLLLMREGRLLATASPGELRRRTGATDLEHAFLRLLGTKDASPT